MSETDQHNPDINHLSFALEQYTTTHTATEPLPQKYKDTLPVILKYWDDNRKKAEDTRFKESTADKDAAFTDRFLSSLFGPEDILFCEKELPSNTNYIEEISKDPDLKDKKYLGIFMAHKLSNYYGLKSIMHTSDYDKDGYIRKNYDAIIVPAIKNNITLLAKEADHESVKTILSYLRASGTTEYVGTMLNQPELSDDEKLKLSVDMINTWGLVPIINEVAKLGKKDPEYQKLYSSLQGQEITNIINDTQELYSQIDFKNYALNHPEFTNNEVKLIKHVMDKYHIDKESSEIVDLGAGYGRHAIPLHQEGYNITAFDLQSEHCESMRQDCPTLPVVQENWHNLSLDDPANLIYCLERSAHHNNTPIDMLKFFDAVSTNLDDNGVLLIDFADSSRGFYDEKITAYKDHLRNIGVNEDKLKHLFSGFDANHKMNRLALTRDQILDYASMVGLKLDPAEEKNVHVKDEMYNTYYTFIKDPDFDPYDITLDQINHWVSETSLTKNNDPKVYNTLIKSWGVSLGEAMIYQKILPQVVEGRKAGKVNPVDVITTHNGIMLETTRNF